ncbi:MAG TPA: tripartite tricarboxylate transporter substrate binding protein [Burkholderiales bacterium]|nr:tripartite tricarboxylate transporter substrate binding protein [Burkholderiales bacterium]
MSITRCCAALAAVLLSMSTGVIAQTYPVKPVRIVVPWPPGGSNDIVARIIAQKLTEMNAQQFVVDNRGGAAGTIGSEQVAKSPPDGYTLMIHSATHVSNPHLYGKLPYDTLKDFVGVAPISAQIGILIVHPSLPVKNVKEFIALARSRPGQITYSSSGNGSFVHLAMAQFAAMADLKLVHVPYKGGGPAAISIAAGETQAQTSTIGAVMQQITNKRVRPLAVTSDYRVDVFPDVPTLAQAGVPGYEFTAWIGALAPAGTPKAIVDKLNADIQKILRMPDVSEKLKSQTLDPMFMSPEQFARRLKSDYDKYEKIIKLTGAKID